MNYAIIVSVSEYNDIANNLPGCKNDALAVNDLLKKTNKYDDILVIDSKINSSSVKERISQFITDKNGQQVDEVFFYFTGHGEFYQNEFYYILSDYDKNKRRQTSLQNSEIDSLIKSLNPNLVIKVIDACQSGVTYIKDIHNSIDKYFSDTKGTFKKCYFLNSCLDYQSSYQTEKISAFTASFINAVANHMEDTIRYKDIVDYISDDFDNETMQTPLFVIQADFTEIFAIIPNEIRDKIKKQYSIIVENLVSNTNTFDIKHLTLAEVVIEEAKEYSTHKEVIDLLNKIPAHVTNFKIIPELEPLYDVNIKYNIYNTGIPKLNEIGTWLKDNEHSFFAKPTYEEVAYQEEARATTLGMLMGNIPTKMITKYKKVIDGFELNVDVPYKSIEIVFNSKYQNIPSYILIIIHLISKRDIKFYYSFTNYIDNNWTQREINSNFKWQNCDFTIKSEIEILDFLSKVFSEFNEFIFTILSKKYKNNLPDKV